MTTQTTAGPLFGIELNRYAGPVRAVSTHLADAPLDDSEISERFARAAWSHLAEPADSTAGTVVQALGATAALEAVAGRWDAPQLLEVLRERIGSDNSPTLDELSTGLEQWTPRFAPQTILRALSTAVRLQVQLLTPADPEWPTGLDDLDTHAPFALWARGDLAILETLDKSLTVVGARASTGYGEHATMEAVNDLVQRGYTIASGAAYGIDGTAHRAALASGGNTIAVLAGGVDRPYPAGHDSLIQRIAVSGLVLSEVPPHTAPTRWMSLIRTIRREPHFSVFSVNRHRILSNRHEYCPFCSFGQSVWRGRETEAWRMAQRNGTQRRLAGAVDIFGRERRIQGIEGESAMTEYKRGTVLRDQRGRLWRVSNRGNAYEINSGGHRLGSHRYARLSYLANESGPLTPEETDGRPNSDHRSKERDGSANEL